MRAYGHNTFFKGNYLFRQWTDADGVLDYLVFARTYVRDCEDRHGIEAAVEAVLDSCPCADEPARASTATSRPRPAAARRSPAPSAEREEYARRNYDDLWRTVPAAWSSHQRRSAAAHRLPARAAKRTCCTSSRSTRPKLEPWQKRTGAHRAQGRAVLLPADADQGHERGLGHLLALHPAQPPAPTRAAISDGFDDGGPAKPHQRGQPARLRRARLRRHEPLCAGLRHDVGDIRRICEAPTRRGPPVVPRHRRRRLAARRWTSPCATYKDESFIAPVPGRRA